MALFSIPGFYSFAEKSILKAAGVKTLEAFKAKYGDKNFSQAGQAGAVPAPDSAPMTGAPKATDVGKPDDFNIVNNWDAPLFNTHNSSTMADLENDDMRDAHGTNGTSYDNEER